MGRWAIPKTENTNLLLETVKAVIGLSHKTTFILNALNVVANAYIGTLKRFCRIGQTLKDYKFLNKGKKIK